MYRLHSTFRHLALPWLVVVLILSTPALSADETTTTGTQAAPPPAPVKVLMATNHGDVVLELFPEYAPVTVENFLDYVDKGHYDGLIFHRVIPGFMIQGGGFDPELKKRKTGPPIHSEADNGLLNGRGTIAMARTREVHSATAQFFINLKNNTFLNHGARDFGYAVFGRVLEGMDVVDAIAAQPTRRVGGHANLPAKPVLIRSMSRVETKPSG